MLKKKKFEIELQQLLRIITELAHLTLILKIEYERKLHKNIIDNYALNELAPVRE